jgi:Arc/MetJ family transcription regulator
MHTSKIELIMRTTLDIPENLLSEAMRVTKAKTKTEVIKFALENIIQKNKLKNLKNYRRKIELKINMDLLRKRN